MSIFEKNILNAFGKTGQEWLDNLPGLIKKLAGAWNLSDIKIFEKMNWNYVASALQNYKAPVVLKISCDQQSLVNEFNALQHFNGCGAIRVLDFDIENSALLLERAIPGEILERHLEQVIPIYADIIKKLAEIPLKSEIDSKFINLDTWLGSLDKISDSRIDPRFIKKAKQLKIYLLSTMKNKYLCHGDLHLENIISDSETWIAIDPKGAIGEMEFEASAFDLITADEMKNSLNPSALILKRIDLLADVLSIDCERLLAWIFLRNILSAQWFIEDRGDPSFKIEIVECLDAVFSVDEQAFEEFQKLLAKPLPATEKLRRLLETKAPWEKF